MTRQDARRFVVAYDVPDDHRRAALAKLLQTYGDRVQYSVFVVDCGRAGMLRLTDSIKNTVMLAEDSVLICDLGLTSSIGPQVFSYVGRHRPLTSPPSFVI